MEFHQFKKVLDNACLSEYHTITHYTSKLKTLQSISLVIGIIFRKDTPDDSDYGWNGLLG